MGKIRKREEIDIEQIVNIWYQASSLAHPFLETEFVEKTKNDLIDIYLPNTETWVYEDNYKVVGFISMRGNEIGGLFVLPSYHCLGIGTQLINWVKELHKELEVEVFEKNTIGRAFYEKCGFTTLKNYFHRESQNHIIILHLK